MTGARRASAAIFALAVVIGVVGRVPGATMVSPPAGAQTPTSHGSPDSQGVGTFVWRPCGPGVAQCSTLRVPLDYAMVNGRTIAIAVTRVRARLSKRRIGSLFVNPGGPGASGIVFAQLLGRILDPSVTDRFDIVGFDPRGVGFSSPIRCVSGTTLDRIQHLDPSPDDNSEVEALQQAAKELAQACGANNPETLGHVDTIDTARDMDRIRAALRDPTITYLGFSYGTVLGLTYAQLFPQHLRAYALDGVLDPAVSLDDRNQQQAVGFDRNLTAFLADCSRQPKCPFQTGGHPAAAFEALMAKVDASPIRVESRWLGPAELTAAVVSQLYNTQRGWPRLAQLLAAAEQGDGRPALERFDNYVDRHQDGTYDNTNEANLAVNCLDLPTPREPAHVVAEAQRIARLAPVFGPAAVWYNAPCAYWPVAAVGLPTLVPRGAPAALLIGNTDDPATPYVWAQSVAKRLPDSMLLTYVHDGHTAYLSGPPCIRNAVNSYLVSLKPVVNGTTCR